MASIIKRKKNYSVVYNYVDENGETKQKWETWHTHKEALKRKAEIENQQHTGTFLPPSNQTITEFLYAHRCRNSNSPRWAFPAAGRFLCPHH